MQIILTQSQLLELINDEFFTLKFDNPKIQEIYDLYKNTLTEGGRCTKATKKASSTRKGKKWMKCVKNPNGKGYVRRHWGQKGVWVTGKKGDTKRKKGFRARHGCSTAKKNSSKDLACKDW